MFQNSYLKMSADGIFTTIPTIVMSDVKFNYSNWEFSDINISMTNCNTSLLYLNVNSCEKNSSLTKFTLRVNIQNSTLGCWNFSCIKDVQISDCSIIGNPLCCSKMMIDITNSTAVLDNLSIRKVNFKCSSNEVCGLAINLFSEVLIKNSFYGKNKNVAISVHNWSNLLMENCTVSGNNVYSGAYNGVIFGSQSVVSIINCKIEKNTIPKSSTVCLIDHSAITVKNSTFIDNRGENLGASVVVREESTLEVKNSTFMKNGAFSGAGAAAIENSRLFISESVFDGNTGTIGGAIFVDENATIICMSSNFSNNVATMNGGAISGQRANITLSNLIMTQNHKMGALSFVFSKFIDIYDCYFIKNTDGAIFVRGVIELAVMNSDFIQNEARSGAAIYMEDCKNFTMSHGRLFRNVGSRYAAIYGQSTNLYIDSSIFEANSGGVFYVKNESMIMWNSCAKHNDAENGGVILGNRCTLNLMHCVFENNTAYENGGALSIAESHFKADNVTYLNNTVSGSAGAIWAERCTVYVINSIFYGNNAPLGSAGAIYISAETLKIVNTTFSYSNAIYAGVLEVNNVRKISLIRSNFVDNFSVIGGVINVTRSTFLAINSMFERNVARQSSNGGCLVFYHVQVAFEKCAFNTNRNSDFRGEGKGGAITSFHCELRISLSTFNNYEAYYGKDIFLSNNLLTYLSTFNHSISLNSNDQNFKQKAFKKNILSTDLRRDVMIRETLYASGTISL